MREKLWNTIHQMDIRIDTIKDPLLLELATGIRECLIDMLKDHAAGLECEKWRTECLTLFSESFERCPDREKILFFLRVTEGPGDFLYSAINRKDPERLRNLCLAQRDRICFFHAMKQLRNNMIHQLPAIERIEEEQLALMREKLLDEQFNDLLLLYRKSSFIQQNGSNNSRFKHTLREEMPDELKQELEESMTRIRLNRESLQNSQEEFDNFFLEQRSFDQLSGYQVCKDIERRMKTDANQRTSAKEEECRDQKGHPESVAFQSAHAQHREWREENVSGYRIHETEGD